MNLSKLSNGKNFPDELPVIIEIPQGSSVKYEMDKESETIFVDRFLPPAMFYPFNYGFVPHTMSGDGDPLDVLVISSLPVAPGTVIPSRPIGMLETEDEDGIDTKIIAVPTKKVDLYYRSIESIDDINEMVKAQIKHFYEHYKDLEEGKWVKVRDFLSKEKALEAIKLAVK